MVRGSFTDITMTLAVSHRVTVMCGGVVYVTEDRKVDGFFETMTVAENLQIGVLSQCPNPFQVVSLSRARMIALSSGNQQKVAIAKALIQSPNVIIFDAPKRGVDVRGPSWKSPS